MPFANRGGVVPILRKYLGGGSRFFGDRTDIAIEIVGKLSDLTGTDMVMVAPRQQGGAGGRAHGGGVEAVIAKAVFHQPGHGRRVYRPAKSVRVAEAGIIGHKNNNIGCVLWQAFGFMPPLVLGFTQGAAGNAGGWHLWKRED